MVKIPIFAGVGAAILGTAGTAAAGAGATAVVGGIASAAAVAGVGAAVYGGVTAAAAAKKEAAAAENAQNNQNITGVGNPTTTVGSSNASGVDNLGRAALISTSPQGVQGTDPTLRYKLLGNTTGLGNS